MRSIRPLLAFRRAVGAECAARHRREARQRNWRIASPVPPSRHRFKYSLFYGRPGERIVLFDNERGKGDHKHIGAVETEYRFRGPERLMEDFKTAVREARRNVSWARN